VCAAIALWAAWRGRGAAALVLGAIGALLIVFALASPRMLRRPSAWWWRLAHALGWVNTRVLLSAFYLLILTPVAAARRLAGADPLRLKRDAARSGWTPYPARLNDPKHYERMY
jgi:hypothetical protein